MSVPTYGVWQIFSDKQFADVVAYRYSKEEEMI